MRRAWWCAREFAAIEADAWRQVLSVVDWTSLCIGLLWLAFSVALVALFVVTA